MIIWLLIVCFCLLMVFVWFWIFFVCWLIVCWLLINWLLIFVSFVWVFFNFCLVCCLVWNLGVKNWLYVIYLEKLSMLMIVSVIVIISRLFKEVMVLVNFDIFWFFWMYEMRWIWFLKIVILLNYDLLICIYVIWGWGFDELISFLFLIWKYNLSWSFFDFVMVMISLLLEIVYLLMVWCVEFCLLIW